MEPFQFVAPPRGHAAIRPYLPHQPSPPLRPVDFSIEERDQPAVINEPRQTMDPDVEEARRAHQVQGPSEGVMARYGVRVLPPRDHRRGWDHPYSRPGGNSGKGGKSSGNSGKGARAAEAMRRAAAAAAREGAAHPIPPGRESGPPAESNS